MRDPGLVAVLSAIIPGVGRFYNGRTLDGVFWFSITPGLRIGTGERLPHRREAGGRTGVLYNGPA
jgi:hypothetical protein